MCTRSHNVINSHKNFKSGIKGNSMRKISFMLRSWSFSLSFRILLDFGQMVIQPQSQQQHRRLAHRLR